eukprot:COSAG04_NODE_2501_length_4006_cov_2.298439_2_plen_97_part_00
MPLIRAESMMDLRDDTAYGGCSRFCMMQCGGCCCIGLGVIMVAIGSLMPVMVGALIDGNAARAVVLESTTDDLGAPRPRFPSARASLRSPPGLAWR